MTKNKKRKRNKQEKTTETTAEGRKVTFFFGCTHSFQSFICRFAGCLQNSGKRALGYNDLFLLKVTPPGEGKVSKVRNDTGEPGSKMIGVMIGSTRKLRIQIIVAVLRWHHHSQMSAYSEQYSLSRTSW